MSFDDPPSAKAAIDWFDGSPAAPAPPALHPPPLSSGLSSASSRQGVQGQAHQGVLCHPQSRVHAERRRRKRRPRRWVERLWGGGGSRRLLLLTAVLGDAAGFRGRGGGGGPSFDMKGGDWPCPNRWVPPPLGPQPLGCLSGCWRLRFWIPSAVPAETSTLPGDTSVTSVGPPNQETQALAPEVSRGPASLWADAGPTRGAATSA